MSSTYINTTDFHQRTGTVLLPQRDVTTFSSPLVAHVGGQVSGLRGPGFGMTVTKYCNPSDRFLIERLISELNGQRIDLSCDGRIYSIPSNGGVQFFCSYARVVWSDDVPHACGYHDGVKFDFSPAGKVVAQLNLYAVPV